MTWNGAFTALRTRERVRLALSGNRQNSRTKVSAPGGIRNPNLLIRSQMLYPLSYGRMAPKGRDESNGWLRATRNRLCVDRFVSDLQHRGVTGVDVVDEFLDPSFGHLDDEIGAIALLDPAVPEPVVVRQQHGLHAHRRRRVRVHRKRELYPHGPHCARSGQAGKHPGQAEPAGSTRPGCGGRCREWQVARGSMARTT